MTVTTFRCYLIIYPKSHQNRSRSYENVAGYIVRQWEQVLMKGPLLRRLATNVGFRSVKPTRGDSSPQSENFDNSTCLRLNDKDSTDRKASHLLPMSASLRCSLAQDSSCTATIFSVDHATKFCDQSSEAELSAFIPEGQCQYVELSCKPRSSSLTDSLSSIKVEFDDEVRRVKILPLPANKEIRWEDSWVQEKKGSSYETLGVLMAVATARAGVVVRSIVLSRNSSLEPFRHSQSIEVSNTIYDPNMVVCVWASKLSTYLHILDRR
jgi:hypothetical protein